MFRGRSRKTKRRTTVDPARRMLIRQIIIGVLSLGLVAGLLTGVWHVTRLPAVTITTVTAIGGITIEPTTVVAAAEDVLEGSYYRLIPYRFSYLYPRTAMEARLLELPRMQSVRIERTDHQALAITYTEYEPYALWCDAAGDCVFIDETGYAFTTAPELRGGVFLRYRNPDQDPVVATVGVTPTLLTDTTAAARTMAAELDLRVHTIVFDDRDVVYQLGGGGEIRTVRSDSVETILTNLETILQSSEFSHLTPGNFAYVDLRYGNKAFVQEALPETATSTATNTPPITAE